LTGISVVQHGDPADFADQAANWLLQREAENNLLLGILPALITGQYSFETPLYLATVEANDELVGCAFRTPPFHLGVTTMPAQGHAALIADVATVFPRLPGVIGPPASAQGVAQAWIAARGGHARLAMQQGIYELDHVTFPSNMPAGTTRIADSADAELLYAWAQSFVEDTGIPAHDVHGLSDRLVAERSMMLWEDEGEPCCMAAVNGPTPNGIRVSYVYTPPAKRGHGYASALVAHLSQAQLEAGKLLCFLYTDMANPTSNRIYKKLGYRQVAESVEVVIEA